MVQTLPLTLRQLFASVNGGHFLRTTALCINVVQGPCPFPMALPGQAPQQPSSHDLARLKKMLAGGR
jgi:phospholipid/cholesterol/gamma-HCH transport system substrate-binding protein